MWDRNTPSLPGWTDDVYQSLERSLRDRSDTKSVTRQQATEIVAEANPDFSSADIDHALDQPLNRGWLYEVDDRLFVTEFHFSESGDVDS